MTGDLLVLDVNETLFSLDAVRDRFDEVGLGADRVPLWFSRVLRDGFAAAAADRFTTFPDLARHHLRSFDPDVDADHVIAAFDEVTAHDDVAPGLRLAADAGMQVATFTNGTAAITRGFLERSGLDGLVGQVLDVSGPQRWKPDPMAYRWAVEAVGGAPDRTTLLAVHPWDVHGAMAAGLAGAWVNRDEETWPAPWPGPDVRHERFDGAVSAVLARRST